MFKTLAVKYGIRESQITRWVDSYRLNGDSVLTEKRSQYNPDFNYSVLQHMCLEELSFTQTAIFFDLRGVSRVVWNLQCNHHNGGITALAQIPIESSRVMTLTQFSNHSEVSKSGSLLF